MVYGIKLRFCFRQANHTDKIAIALGLGADLVNIARGMMISVGCIMSQQCHLNTCPVGVATTDPKRKKRSL